LVGNAEAIQKLSRCLLSRNALRGNQWDYVPEADFWPVAQILVFPSLDNNFEIMSNLGRRANFIIPANVERREFGVLLLELWDDKTEIPAES